MPGNWGSGEAWRHELVLYLRARETFEADPPTAYYRLFRLIVKGMPGDESQSIQHLQVHNSCNPMDTPSITRGTDVEGVDYFEVSMSFTETGDD